MSALRGLALLLVGVCVLGAGAAGLGFALLPAASGGPVVPPLGSPPGWERALAMGDGA